MKDEAEKTAGSVALHARFGHALTGLWRGGWRVLRGGEEDADARYRRWLPWRWIPWRRLSKRAWLAIFGLTALGYLLLGWLQGRYPDLPPAPSTKVVGSAAHASAAGSSAADPSVVRPRSATGASAAGTSATGASTAGIPAAVVVEGGSAIVLTTAELMRAQLDALGGWTPNDIFPSPSYFFDNLPQFQLGVLQVTRHTTRVLRDHLTRQRTSDGVHPLTDRAFVAFANDPQRWAFPSAENAFGRGIDALDAFEGTLKEREDVAFYARTDNLVQLLEPFVSELGAVTTRLLDAQRGEASWWKTDDNFHYAQGVGYAMLGVMRAAALDFDAVLQDKNAVEITQAILRSLEASRFAPVFVTNGSKAGLLANHSSNCKVFLDDARQKMGSLISILRQG